MKTTRLSLAAFLLLSLSACALLGGGANDRRATIYVLDPRVEARPDWPSVDWQLALGNAEASRLTDSLRIAVRPAGHEMQVYKGAAWGKMPTDMIEDAILRTMEDSGRIPAIARQGSGIGAEYKLVLDLRRFESDYAGQPVPAAHIELNAKLLHTRDQRVVAARTFEQAVPAASTAVADVVDAFEQSLATITTDLVGWVLQSGQAHGHAHPEPAPAGRPVPVVPVPVPVPAR